MPRNAATQTQKSEPGPPTAIADATPAMLPQPTQPPIAIHTASKGDTVPSFLFFASLDVKAPKVFFIT